MGQKRMLCHMKSNRDGSGVAISNLNIDIAHRRIEGSRIRIGYSFIRRNRSWRRKRDEAAGVRRKTGTEPSKHDQDAHPLLEARRIGGQHEHGTYISIAY